MVTRRRQHWIIAGTFSYFASKYLVEGSQEGQQSGTARFVSSRCANGAEIAEAVPWLLRFG